MSKFNLLETNYRDFGAEHRCDWKFVKTDAHVRVVSPISQFILDDREMLNLDYFGKVKNQLESLWSAWSQTLVPTRDTSHIDFAAASADGWDVQFHSPTEDFDPKKPWLLPDGYTLIAIKTIPGTNVSMVAFAVIGIRKEFKTPK